MSAKGHIGEAKFDMVGDDVDPRLRNGLVSYVAFCRSAILERTYDSMSEKTRSRSHFRHATWILHQLLAA